MNHHFFVGGGGTLPLFFEPAPGRIIGRGGIGIGLLTGGGRTGV